MPNATVTGDGYFGRFLGQEGGALMNGTSAFRRRGQRTNTVFPPHEAQQEDGPL